MDLKKKVLEMRNVVRGSKCKAVAVASAVGVSVLSAVPCFAADDINTAMTTALGTVKSDMLGVIAVVAPVGIAIAGIILVWKRGIKLFKNVSN